MKIVIKIKPYIIFLKHKCSFMTEMNRKKLKQKGGTNCTWLKCDQDKWFPCLPISRIQKSGLSFLLLSRKREWMKCNLSVISFCLLSSVFFVHEIFFSFALHRHLSLSFFFKPLPPKFTFWSGFFSSSTPVADLDFEKKLRFKKATISLSPPQWSENVYQEEKKRVLWFFYIYMKKCVSQRDKKALPSGDNAHSNKLCIFSYFYFICI